MKRKVAELSGALLDAAVIRALDSKRSDGSPYPYGPNFKPSRKWENGGPIIQSERINLVSTGRMWSANLDRGEYQEHHLDAETPLIAAMRAYVASKLGDEIDM